MKKLALVLSGGATKGFAHIGVLEVLEENGIKPDLIVGTSMGAIVGGMYACGICVQKLMEITKNFSKKKISDVSLYHAFAKGSIMRGKRIEKYVHGLLHEYTDKNLKIPFISVATELSTGKQINLKKGLIWKNVLASSAMPAVFPPIEIDGKILCDGGIKDNLPVDVAKANMPEAVVLAIDVIGDYSKQVEQGKFKMINTILNMSTLYMTQSMKNSAKLADISVVISQPNIEQMDFNEKDSINAIENGRIAMNKEIKNLKILLKK